MKIGWVVILSIVLGLASCQTEERLVAPPQESLTRQSPLSLLLKRVSQHPTSMDNMIDSTNCLSLRLPLSVVINGESVSVTSEAHYGTVLFILNESEDDIDSIELVFPVIAVLKNAEEIVVNSQQQLNEVVLMCGPDDGAAEITCVDINYPISINTYDSDFQIANLITIENDIAFYNFLSSTTPDVFEIIYPVSVNQFDGQILIVANNAALQSVIEDNSGTCAMPGNRQ